MPKGGVCDKEIGNVCIIVASLQVSDILLYPRVPIMRFQQRSSNKVDLVKDLPVSSVLELLVLDNLDPVVVGILTSQ